MFSCFFYFFDETFGKQRASEFLRYLFKLNLFTNHFLGQNKNRLVIRKLSLELQKHQTLGGFEIGALWARMHTERKTIDSFHYRKGKKYLPSIYVSE